MSNTILDFPSRVPSPITRVNLGMDFTSSLALQYIKEALHRVGALNVPTALIVHRALTLYAETLTQDAAPTNPHIEGGTLAALISVMRMPKSEPASLGQQDDERQQQERLDNAPQGSPLPPFGDIQWGIGHTAKAKQFRAEHSREPEDQAQQFISN